MHAASNPADTPLHCNPSSFHGRKWFRAKNPWQSKRRSCTTATHVSKSHFNWHLPCDANHGPVTAPGPRFPSCSATHLSLISLVFILLTITHFSVASLPYTPYRKAEVPTDSKGSIFFRYHYPEIAPSVLISYFPAIQSKYNTGHHDSMGPDQSNLTGHLLWSQYCEHRQCFSSGALIFVGCLPQEKRLLKWAHGRKKCLVSEKISFSSFFPIFLPFNQIKWELSLPYA